MYETNFELHIPEPLKVLMKLIMEFYMCLHKSLGRGPWKIGFDTTFVFLASIYIFSF